MKTLFVHNITLSLPIGLMLLFGGCKPAENETISETKTLDNFAKEDGDKLTINKCGIEYTGKETLSEYVESVKDKVKGAETYKNAALGVMTVVPENMLKAFFGPGLTGSVVIVPKAKAAALCKEIPFSAGEKELAGADGIVPTCWRQPEPGQPPEIVLPEDKELIRHSLLRIFAYTFTEAFAGALKEAAAGNLAGDDVKAAVNGFFAERDVIAKKFLKDLKKLNRPEVYQKLAAFKAMDSDKFGNYVYAEAVDSYYCSNDSREAFESLFKKTWNRFTDKQKVNSAINLFGEKT